MKELPTALELGDCLARFEVHWDQNQKTEALIARRFTQELENILTQHRDPKPKRVYRGDIWQADQALDPRLEDIKRRYAHYCINDISLIA